MWQAIRVFIIAIMFAIGATMIVLSLFPVMIHKSKWLYKKYIHELEEDESYKKLYNRGLTCIGKTVLVTGFFLLIVTIILLLFII